MRHGEALFWLWYHAEQLVFAFSLGVYFSYVPRLVDFVADSDVESLVLSGVTADCVRRRLCPGSSAMHLSPRDPDTEGWHSQRERPGRTSNTAFEGLEASRVSLSKPGLCKCITRSAREKATTPEIKFS